MVTHNAFFKLQSWYERQAVKRHKTHPVWTMVSHDAFFYVSIDVPAKGLTKTFSFTKLSNSKMLSATGRQNKRVTIVDNPI